MSARLIWATPEIDRHIGYIARVSNPGNQDNPHVMGLLRYMAAHGHWSPFEMASACIEILMTRDIARQILRHRSFSFQEFSQRYAEVVDLPDVGLRECRMQDTKNRQNSLPADNEDIADRWKTMQLDVAEIALDSYRSALALGIAKEQARALLPEGLTPSRVYVAGTMRSWITYLKQRLDSSTQKEHRQIAETVKDVLTAVAPVTMSAFFGVGND